MHAPNFKDLTGQVFGLLTVLEFFCRMERRAAWLCRCACGNLTVVLGKSLLNGNTNSCGCRERMKHGQSPKGRPSGAYRSWLSMKQRCLNPKSTSWKNYGGKGVTIFEPWIDSFEAFVAHIGDRSAGTSIDRFPNKDGNYEPGNVRWATRKQQQNNVRRNRLITIRGETLTLMQWCERSGVEYATIFHRLKNGWPAEQAVFSPSQNQR